MPLLQGTDGAGDAAWVTTLTDTLTATAVLCPAAEVAVVAADPTPTSGTSGTVYRMSTTGGAYSITLPTAVVGQTFTFVFTAITVTNDLTFNCAAVTNAMVGCVTISPDDGAENTWAICADGITHDRMLINMNGAGNVLVGSYVRFTALTSTLWYVEGSIAASAAAAGAVVFSSN